MMDPDQQPADSEATIPEQPQSPAATPQVAPHDPSFYESEGAQQADAVGAVAAPPKRGKFGFGLVLVGFVVLAVAVVLILMSGRPRQDTLTSDLGPGIYTPAGLRGRLVTKWDGKAEYQLHIEPIDTLQNDGFTAVTANPRQPIYINIRILDSTGFALCGKQILFHFDPRKSAASPPSSSTPAAKKADTEQTAAREADLQRQQAGEAERERGKDFFESQVSGDGKVIAVNALGDLPCSVDQYKRADYWDFSTNFPTTAEQEELLGHPSGQAQRDQGSDDARGPARRQKAAKKQAPAFFIQGDERVTGYDPSRAVLEAGLGKSFLIDKKSEQAVAAGWAANYSVIHYKCDLHVTCALTGAGGATAVHARLSQ